MGGRGGLREETEYSGFIVCWRDIFSPLFLFLSFYQQRGIVLTGQKKGADLSRSYSRENVEKMDGQWD